MHDTSLALGYDCAQPNSELGVAALPVRDQQPSTPKHQNHLANHAAHAQAQDLNAALIAMVNQHDKLWHEWDRLVEENEDDPRIDAFSGEAVELERKILATPAFTAKGLTGKRRVVERAELDPGTTWALSRPSSRSTPSASPPPA